MQVAIPWLQQKAAEAPLANQRYSALNPVAFVLPVSVLPEPVPLVQEKKNVRPDDAEKNH